MRNYELINNIYELCREDAAVLERFTERYVRNTTLVKIENLIEKERPELKDNKHTDGCGYDD